MKKTEMEAHSFRERLRRNKEEWTAEKTKADAEIERLWKGVGVDMEAVVRSLDFKPIFRVLDGLAADTIRARILCYDSSFNVDLMDRPDNPLCDPNAPTPKDYSQEGGSVPISPEENFNVDQVDQSSVKSGP